MKCITREMKMYKYIFANIDLASGTVHNTREFHVPVPMSRKAIKERCEADNSVMIHKEEFVVRYSLPLSKFVEACEAYAAEVAAGNEPPIDPEDAEDEDEV